MLRKTKYKIITYALLMVLLLLVFGFAYWYELALQRDYKRLGDLKIWQNIMLDYYNQNGSYAIPYCETGMDIADCLTLPNSKNIKYNIRDPKNTGIYRYQVRQLANDDYQISFGLEVGVGGLPAGEYIWTKTGVAQ